MPGIPRRRIGRKLLVASLGVASVSYVACGSSTGTSTFNEPEGGTVDGSTNDQLVGNLAVPDSNFRDTNPPEDAPVDQLVANLVPPPFDSGIDSGHDAAKD
jgi:hypothetical protein